MAFWLTEHDTISGVLACLDYFGAPMNATSIRFAGCPQPLPRQPSVHRGLGQGMTFAQPQLRYPGG